MRRAAHVPPLALAVLALAVLVLALTACDGERTPSHIAFDLVPAESGFRFRHELPGGTLDNLPKSAMGGVGVFDADGDGLLDVYCVNGGWNDAIAGSGRRPAQVPTSRLFRNLGGWRFEDVTERAGVGFAGAGMGICIGDVDNDGDVDFFVPAYGRTALYLGRGDGTFEDASARSGIAAGMHAGACFLDYDRDGLLDLFAAQYVDPRGADPSVVTTNQEGDFPGPGAYRGQPARLYRGRGDGTFEDVTSKAGVGTPGKGMGALATDVDGDGWIDIVVANDTEANHVWLNKGDGTFRDAAATLGMAFGLDAEPRGSMGVSAADLDRDGRLDYLVPDTRGGAVYAGRERWYTDRARDWGLAAGSHAQTGWADVPFDADNDGWIDVYKVHGDVRTLYTQPSFLLRNDAGRFARVDVGPEGRAAAAEVDLAGRSAVAGDLDGDGLQDLVVMGLNSHAVMLRNRSTGAGNWVRLRLVGTKSNRMALGARVSGRCSDLPLVGEVSGSTSYISAGDVRLHFGLGADDEMADVVVRWPAGAEQRLGDLDAGREHVIREP